MVMLRLKTVPGTVAGAVPAPGSANSPEDVAPPLAILPSARPSVAQMETAPEENEPATRLYARSPVLVPASSKPTAVAAPVASIGISQVLKMVASSASRRLPTGILLSVHVARYEIRSRYARSVLGSWWITLQQALFVGVAALVFSAVFKVPVAVYIPYFAISLLFWSFMSACVLESMDALTANGPMIKDRGFSPEVFLFSVVSRNLLVSAHALPISVLLIVGMQAESAVGFLLALPGLILFLVSTAAISYSAGFLAARYRDLKRLSESIIQLAFLVTPILWQPAFVGERNAFVVDLNPLAHVFNAWRQPLLDGTFAPTSFAVSALIAALAIFMALLVRRRMLQIAVWV